jgi:hypothetical protein
MRSLGWITGGLAAHFARLGAGQVQLGHTAPLAIPWVALATTESAKELAVPWLSAAVVG